VARLRGGMAGGKNFYDERETMSPQERRSYQEENLRQIVDIGYQKAPAIKDKMDEAGVKPSDIRTVKDLEKIPVTTKEDLVKLRKKYGHFAGLLTIPVTKLRRIYRSAGPIYDACIPGDDVALAFTKSYFAAGFTPEDIVIITPSYHMVPAGLTLEEGLLHLGAVHIPTGTGNSEIQVEIMHDLGVTGYIGFPDFLLTLIKRAESMGYDFRRDFKLRIAQIAGAMYPPSLRKIYEEDYGIETCQNYASAELGLYAYECRKKNGMHLNDDFIIEIADPETGKQLGPGEVGEVVVTPFYKSLPFIRFGTRDLSYYTDEPCSCGRTAPRLVSVVGRVGETVRARGLFLYPGEVTQSISGIAGISRFQVAVGRKENRDQVVFKLELSDEAINKESLQDEVQARFRERCKLGIDQFEFLPKGSIPEQHKVLIDERAWG